jgi:predicted nucleic acid-binding Zn ribbon protein
LFQGITEPPVKKCPHCGKRTAKRLIGAGAGIIFKGSGFYQTDYRSEEYKSKAKADSATATVSPKTDSSVESKSPKKTKDKTD